jgi:argininosuccinate lyase
MTSNTLWHGRYEQQAAESLRKLNDSFPFDKRMYASDTLCSAAYAQAIAKIGVLTEAEAAQIVPGLLAVTVEFDKGTFTVAPGDEDIHTAVERRLGEMIGAAAGKLHTGRSRNDQVATDTRHWLAQATSEVEKLVIAVQIALLDQAKLHLDTLMPGYTHLRAAQPITAAHWLMSFFWMLTRDVKRFEASRESTLISPLGSGALSGTPYPVDRAALAESMGFLGVTENSLDGVSDRDFIVEFLSAASLMMVHLSRFAEDVILYSSPQFGFIKLDERFTTGSSLMPQKQNPDVLELARGKAGRIAGHLSGLLNTLKGLPSTYNKDLQEDKEPLFDTVDTLQTLLPALTGLINTMRFEPEKMLSALDEGMLATDAADYLVTKGIPFREAHGIIGKLVRRSLDTDTPLSKLSLETYKSISPVFDTDIYAVFDFAAAVAKRKSAGGTAPDAVRHQIDQAEAWLNTHSSDQ